MLDLLKAYDIVLSGKRILIIGQSDLIGKPLARELMRYRAQVFSVNHTIDQERLRQLALGCDIIISCTGKVHLIDQTRVRDDQTQVVVDVGRGSFE